MTGSLFSKTCPHCGEEYSGIEHDCDELPPTADDECPLCNQPMSSWLDHMRRCGAREQ